MAIKILEPKLIPEVDEAIIEKMRAAINPLIYSETEGRGYYSIDTTKCHLRDTSYLWEAQPLKKIKDYGDHYDAVGIITFHTWGFYGLFKPSLYEVLSQINRAFPNWEQVEYFYLQSENLNKDNIMGEYQWCKCWLWPKEE